MMKGILRASTRWRNPEYRDALAFRAPSPADPDRRTALSVLGALSVCHLLNDLLQSLLPAIYPMLKADFGLDYWQIGLVTLSNSVTASLLQPLVGAYTDRRPWPHSLAIGMSCTLAGLLLLAFAPRYGLLLAGAAAVGVGSSVFHPESSRIARLASGGRHGFAQSLFQTGGNFGTSIGPLLAAFIIVPQGRQSLAWFSVLALVTIVLLARIGRWYASTPAVRSRVGGPARLSAPPRPTPAESRGLALLMALVFTKYVYLTSLTSYFMFFLMHRFGVGVQTAQLHLFLFLGAVAAGTFIGGPVGDRVGRRSVIWVSILGVLPFTLALPYANLFWTGVLSVIIGVVLASAFSAILVYAQELLPGRVGTVAGLFFGLAFGTAGVAALALGRLADAIGIEAVFRLCAVVPALGILAAWLPREPPSTRRA
jgi:FSR family fosmidomycin resistance protein-like MFS transporter